MKLKYLIFCIVGMIGLISCSNNNHTFSTDVPVATEATYITSTSFLANWNVVDNATEYELQISKKVSFDDAAIIENLAGPTVVSSINANTEYFYRVRATNLNKDPSIFSNVIRVITLPVAPIVLPASNITQTSFQANWNTVVGVKKYLLYVSKDNFTSDPPVYVEGYEGLNVAGTSCQIKDLSKGSFYYYRLKSIVENRISKTSNSQSVQTYYN